MPAIGDVARVLVLEQRKPKLVVPRQGISEESGLGAHFGGPQHPDCIRVFTPEDWDARSSTKPRTNNHSHLAVLRNEARQQRDGVLAPTHSGAGEGGG